MPAVMWVILENIVLSKSVTKDHILSDSVERLVLLRAKDVRDSGE